MTTEDRLRDYLRRVTADLHGAQRRLRELEAGRGEPIAIVGMSCRYPGGVWSPDDLWKLVAAGEDATADLPRDRGWDVDSLYDPDPEKRGTSTARRGGFLDEAAWFDAGFFEISPREAVAMDPQQRLLLECSWEVVERAGIDPVSLRGSRTGVFAGVMYQGYGTDVGVVPDEIEGYVGNGIAGSVASGRVAYTLGLEGPAVTVDTACSSSLVALHLACQSLRQGECTMALAGGVTVMATPATFVEFSRQRGLAPDGRCRAFAEGANGTGFSEGVGVLLLERLSRARRQGHRVLAVVRGSAVNQDGASNGLTAPNGPSQERVIRQALANAGLSAGEVDAVEAHGTGTRLGDPIEAQALLAVYGQGREEGRPLWLGSIKSNVGHTQAAAGVAGVMKMVLALRQGVLPKTLHVGEPSREVDWSRGSVRLLEEAVPWPEREEPRRAGVSSFGVSGTNAHVILEEAPPQPEAEGGGEPEGGVVALVVSGRSEGALREQAGRLRAHLERHPEQGMAAVGRTLARTRSQFEWRGVVVGRERRELLEGLAALTGGREAEGVVRGRVGVDGDVGFVFPGQGGQWAGMGGALLRESAEFRRWMASCDEALRPHLGWSVVAALERGTWSEQVEEVQPLLWSVMVSLSGLWRWLGVEPAGVVGHSQGEIAAACVSGGLTLEDGARVVALRSRALATLKGRGGMATVEQGADELGERLERWRGRVVVAAVNSRRWTVVSGASDAIDELVEELSGEGVFARRVRVDYASHSGQVDEVREELLEGLSAIRPRSADVRFYSTVVGRELDTRELDAEYWYRNLRQEVQFEAASREMVRQGRRHLVEVSPHPVLTLVLEDVMQEMGERALVVGTLRRDDGGMGRMLRSLGELHVAGLQVGGRPVDWGRALGSGGTVELPTYAFQRQRYWLKGAEVSRRDVERVGLERVGHPLLSVRVALAEGDGVVLSGRLSLGSEPWLRGHEVMGEVVVPGSAMVELALEGGRAVGLGRVEELTLEAPLVLAEQGGVTVQVRVGREERDGRQVSVHARAEGGDGTWVRHAGGRLAETLEGGGEELASWPPAGAGEVELAGFYEQMAVAGLSYGPGFRGMGKAWTRDGEAYAEVRLPAGEGLDAGGYGLHPALLDAALHPLALLGGEKGRAGLLFSWAGVELHRSGATRLRVRARRAEEGAYAVALADELGRTVATIEGVSVRPVGAGGLRGEPLHRVEWLPVTAEGEPGDDWMVLGDALPEPGARRCRDLSELLAELDQGGSAPEAVIVPWPGEGELPGSAHELAGRALGFLQRWLAEERLAACRLVVVTRRAVAAAPGEDVLDLAAAPLWGLVRSAQSEHPERALTLVDLDEDAGLRGALAAMASGEAQVAVRGRRTLASRLVRMTGELSPVTWRAGGTVLVTGGTGTLGGLVARHLVVEHGVQNLLLVSRRGESAPGAAELRRALEELGADARVAACDVADPEALTALLASIPADRLLTAVVHAAGVIDDGLLTTLTAEQLERVLRAKLDAAVALDRHTRDLPLTAFVLFSSMSGTLGAAGQANYAAANAFLDALAHHRRARGLPATSLVWGYWAETSGLTAQLGQAGIARMARAGVLPLSRESGLGLFDAALACGDAAPVAFRLDRRPTDAVPETVPPLLRGLVRTRRRETANRGATLRGRLAGLRDRDRDRALLDLIRSEAATVLGHGSTDAIEPDRPLGELGLDSLMALELRRRLGSATGLRLPTTVLFDHPTPEALCRRLRGDLLDEGAEVVAVAPRGALDASEPIAIVGMSCRYPGGVSSPDDLWDLVVAGRDAVGPFPVERGWDVDRLYDPDPDRKGTSSAREGGFVRDAEWFDPAFFGISPREALLIDPQHRLVLETAWEALEHAGINPRSLQGTRTGVYLGSMGGDYAGLLLRQAPDAVEGYLGTSGSSSAASGRVSYTLGLEGPAVTVDTACSSSLVALHLACQSLRQGECELALVGGVTVMATPATFIEFSRQRGLAPDGRCKSFAEGADGTGWGEGAGMLVVERLSTALARGRRVLAVVRGSAVNQDGRTQGFSAPNGPSQERVIRQALANAGLESWEVDAVEAHGTGTRLGDPIEAQALLSTYGQGREEGRPLWLGSIKSNVGHTQAAAGVAGVMKMVMALREGLLPKTLHVEEPSREVDWSRGSVRLLQEAVPWPEVEEPRRAAVSSFGLSGTNAHVILEEAPRVEAEGGGEELEGDVVALVVSGRSEEALREQAGRLRAHLERHPEQGMAAVGRTLAQGRARLEHRGVVVGLEREELLAGLEALAKGEERAGVVAGRVEEGGVAFLFPGPGGQRVGMGRELYRRSGAFREAFDEVCGQVDGRLGRSLREVMWEDTDGLLDRTACAEPALLVLGVSLARMLGELGVRPDWVLGDSVGEVVAACVAGVMTVAEASELVVARNGSMEELGRVAGRLGLRQPEVPLVSSVSGEGVGEAVCDRGYWVRQATESTRFGAGVEWLGRQGVRRCVALGPEGALTGVTVSLLRAGRSEVGMAVWALAQLEVLGAGVDWGSWYGRGEMVELPAYAFQRRRYWLTGKTGAADASRMGLEESEHPLLGAVVELGEGEGLLLTGRLSRETTRWLGGQVVPGTVMLEMVLEAGREVGLGRVEELTLEAPLLMPERGGVKVRVRVGEEAADGRRVSVSAREEGGDGPWVRHASGRLAESRAMDGEELEPWPPAGATEVEVAGLNAQLTEAELPGLERAWKGGAEGEVYGEVRLPEGWQAQGYGLHPALLEAALHTLGLQDGVKGKAALLFALTGVELYRRGASGVRVRARPAEGGACAVALVDEAGRPVATIEGATVRPVGAAGLRRQQLHRVEWVPAVAEGERAGGWLALGDAAADLGGERCADLPALQAELDQGRPAPELVVTSWVGDGELPGSARELTGRALACLQRWLADERLAGTGLAMVTRRAVAAAPEEDVLDLAAAPLWGMVRSAQSEHPERALVLVDLDAGPDPRRGLAAAMACGEPQVAVRGRRRLVPRLTRVVGGPARLVWAEEGTVLITGGTGPLGSLVARHLVANHGARHLLLASRQGDAAPGAAELRRELEGLGAEVRVAACDVGDGAALAALLASIPAEWPLTGVVHTAGVLDDGLLTSLSPGQLERVLRPKLDAAVALDRQTRELPLGAFVLFASISGVLGGPGQANYAAGNAFLDALAHRRRAQGLPAVSLAWGPWDAGSGMYARISDADRARTRRGGIPAFSPAEGLALFDAALVLNAPTAVPARIDVSALRAQGGAHGPLLRGLIGPIGEEAGPEPELRQGLAPLSGRDRARLLADLVRGEVATVLGHGSEARIDEGAGFVDLGMDSLMALELRRRLGRRTGLRLPATVAFDHPAVRDLARHLQERFEVELGDAGTDRQPGGGGRPRSEEPEALPTDLESLDESTLLDVAGTFLRRSEEEGGS
jgi:acyl transferase domain-containing protein/short-subunit dehydrogenase/acyl carrier protein